MRAVSARQEGPIGLGEVIKEALGEDRDEVAVDTGIATAVFSLAKRSVFMVDGEVDAESCAQLRRRVKKDCGASLGSRLGASQ